MSSEKRSRSRKPYEIPDLRITDEESAAVKQIMRRLRGKLPESSGEDMTAASVRAGGATASAGSKRASSKRASSMSQLNMSQLTESQLNMSQLNMSQLTESQLSMSQLDESLSINWRSIEHTRIPQVVFDEVLPTLPVAAQALYVQLLRLTLGFQRRMCHVSLDVLKYRCNQSLASVKRHLELLIRRGLVRKVAVRYGGRDRGTYLMPVIPGVLGEAESSQLTMSQLNMSQLTESQLSTSQLTESQLTMSQLNMSQLTMSHKKYDDDDFEIKHHHQKADDDDSPHLRKVKEIYTQLTGNAWTAADTRAYRENGIEQYGLEHVEAVMAAVAERAPERINSFAYFVREIAAAARPESRGARKRRLERIVRRVQQLHVGAANYGLADLVEDVKRACAREGVPFDTDLFNEIIGLG